MNETGTAARAWMNPTESEQRAETQIRRPSLRLISGLEKTESSSWNQWGLTRIIHERFCCNRQSAALAREASFVKQFRNLLTC